MKLLKYGRIYHSDYLLNTQNFPKNYHFILPDTHTYVYVSGGKKC